MKTESFILRYGTYEELYELGVEKLTGVGLAIYPEASSFAIRAQFAQQMMASQSKVYVRLKIIEGRLYIDGEADGLAFTI